MTPFDLIAAAVIGISALIGFSRGAVRELVGLLAFVVSAGAALFLLPLTSPLARHFVSSPLLALALAVVMGFAAVYLVFKTVGYVLASQIHRQTLLGGADRSLGLGIGAVRALILMGLFALVFDHATPAELRPDWITNSFLYPLASASGRMIGRFAPDGLKAAGRLSPFLRGEVGDSTDQPPPGENDAVQTPVPPTNHLVISPASGQKDAATDRPSAPGRRVGRGYTKQARDKLDAIVEKTR